MAWVLKNAIVGVAIIGSTPQTTSFNLTSGDVIGVIVAHSGNTPTLTATWAGNALTQMWRRTVGTVDVVSTGFILGSGAATLTAGTQNVVITQSASVDFLQCLIFSFTGSDVTNAAPFRATVYTAFNDEGNTSVTNNVNAATSGDLIIDGVSGYAGTITKGASQTLITSEAAIAGGSYNMGSSYRGYAGSAFDMAWTLGSGGYWSTGAAALIPGAGGAAFIARNQKAILQAVKRAATY